MFTALPSTNLPLAAPILATKLYAPRPRTSFVSRPRLVARLNQGMAQGKLILISAPTGSGKTTLMSEWLHPKKDEFFYPSALIPHPFKVAWLSLDAADNDPVRFLSYCVAALQTVDPKLGQTSLTLLNAPQLLATQADLSPIAALPTTPTHPPALSSTLMPPLVALVNDMVSLSTDIVFILDDYHVIDSPIVHQMLAFMLDNAPPPLRLVILSRVDPPLALAQLRARGQLLELRPPDLRFNPAETALFLNKVMGLNLTAADLKTLEARTEGWIAGLQLAGLSLQGCEPAQISHFMVSFSGGHRYVLDYLTTEVIQRQPAALQEFLLRTSILDRLCGPLCDILLNSEAHTPEDSGKSNLSPTPLPSPASGQTILEQLEAANLFIIPLDDERRWYRYHHLLTDLLRSRLSDHFSPVEVISLHRRAAAWFEQQGLVAEAMRHALNAADVTHAARLLEQHARSIISRSEMTTLLSWFGELPVQVVHTEAQLPLFQAWALVFTGQLDAVEGLLQQVQHHPGEVTAIRGTVAYFRRDMPQAITLYRQAFELLPENNHFLRGAVALSLGIALSWGGQALEADQVLAQASAISQMTGNLHVTLTALWNQARLALEQGQLRRAAGLGQQALQLVSTNLPETLAAPQPPALGGVYVILGQISYEQDDLPTATHYLEMGLDLGERGADLTITSLAYLGLARVRQAQANPEGALKAAQQAAQLAHQFNSPYWLAQAAAAQARLWLEQGQLEPAQSWAKTGQLSPTDPLDYLREAEYLTLARLLVKRQEIKEAQTLLGRLLEKANEGQRTGRIIELLIIQAAACCQKGDTEAALTCLSQALALAQPEEHIRLFVDEGLPIAKLLTLLNQRSAPLNPAYLKKLLTAFEKAKAEGRKGQANSFQPSARSLQPLVEPLSERELELLQLIAAGMSNQEIAETLVVTVGTVKWHLNNIYGKLGVRSRTQAVARARELGLLT